MPSNREWLNGLAASDPQKLNTWFEAEHVDEIDSERKCPGYDPKNNYCRYHAQNFELNDATVSRLKREKHELAKERDEWKASAKACDSCSGNFYYDCVKLDGIIIEKQNEVDKLTDERDFLAQRVDELNTQVAEQSELIAARGKTIEALEKFMSERKYKLKKQLESKNEQCRKLKAERDKYRELYEAAMSTDYGQLSKEHEQFREEISEMLDAAQQIERIRAKHETQSN
ncbi:MAG: hypothetical protein IKE23_11610 [Exiguobacterium sp.]|nr:hypothetical protein [Exiguobacterium sp.]